MKPLARRPWAFSLGAASALAFVFGLRLLSDNNLEFHLHGGRWILENLAFPERDTYTYTVRDHAYVDLHWLFQVVAYGIYRLLGFPGLSVANALLAAALTLLLGLRMRSSGADPALAGWVLLASTVIMNLRYLMRPENVTFVYLALLCLVLERHLSSPASSGTASGRLWMVPLIQLLWVNTQGLFAIGLIVTGVFWLGASLRARRPDGPLAATLAVSAFVCLLNPYFHVGALFPLHLLSRFDRSNVFAQHILEFYPVWAFDGFFEDKILYGFAAALLAALVLTRRRRAFHELVLPALFLFLALKAVRNVPLFVVVSAPILATALTDAGQRLASARGRLAGLLERTRAVSPRLLGCTCLLLAARIATNAYYTSPGLGAEFRFGVGLDRTTRPLAAGEFLLEHGLAGRLLNTSNIGGWLGWVLPQPVFIDGRLEVMREELFQEEVDSWREGGLAPLLQKYQPELIVFDYPAASRAWLPQLQARADWRCIYVDDVAAIYARGDYARGLPAISPGDLPRVWGVDIPHDEARMRRVLERVVPGKARRWLAGFAQRQVPDDAHAVLGHFCEMSGAVDAAERLYLACLERTPDLSYDTFSALGLLYTTTGRPALAVRCYDQHLRYEPRNPAVHNERGIARTDAGDPEGALRDFTRAIELDGSQALFHYNRGLVYQRLGRLSSAEEDYRRALDIEPGHSGARQGLDLVRQGRR